MPEPSKHALGDPAHVIDVETYPNLFLIGARDLDTGQVWQWSTEPGIGGTLDEARDWFDDRRESLLITFNGMHYDNKMLRTALCHGVDDCAKLYAASQAAIADSSHSMKRTQRTSINGETSFDLLAIHGGAKARIGSLKECGLKCDYPFLRELPYPFDATLTYEQMVEVAEYNGHDLAVTVLVAMASAEQIKARIALAIEFGEETLLNKHDAGVAVAVLKRELFGDEKAAWSPEDTWSCHGSQFAQHFRYNSQPITDLLKRIATWQMRYSLNVTIDADGEEEKTITSTPFSDAVQVGDVTYTIGVGGLHSVDEPGQWVADETFCIVDMDVASFYPALILTRSLVPNHLNAKQFLKVFGSLRDRRITAKRAGETALADGLKIAINSVYGKLKSPTSWLCDPVASVAVTLLGQLTLLLFIDALQGLRDLVIVSANTDGITYRCRREDRALVAEAMQQLAASQGLEVEFVDYARVVRRDVNNYMALKTDGKIKARGAYGYDKSNLGKKASNRIVIDAVQQHFIHGVPIEHTIRTGGDITDFVDYFKATKGYKIVGEDGTDHGGVSRWYLSTGGSRLHKLKVATGARTQLVGTGATVINDLPGAMPNDVDYAAYEAEARKLIDAIENPPAKITWSIPLAELSAAQHAQQQHNREITDPDQAVVATFDLAAASQDYATLTKGNRYDTMKSVAVKIWCKGAGSLTQGDLLALLERVDDAHQYFSGSRKRNLLNIAAWVSGTISPWPLPRTDAEHIARAATWAAENVEPLRKQRRVLYHRSATISDYVSQPALRKFASSGDAHTLACAICSAPVKHGRPIEQDKLLDIMTDVRRHFEASPDDPVEAQPASQAPRPEGSESVPAKTESDAEARFLAKLRSIRLRPMSETQPSARDHSTSNHEIL